jgi:L-threonylcarbamoyladenylate synthase
MPNDPPEYQRHLYAILRELDGMGLRAIYIEVPPDRPEWAAVRDRIIRATQPLPAS